MKNWIKRIESFLSLLLLNGCALSAGEGGNPAFKLFSALGICLAAVFVIFFIVVKMREKD
jgi:hypothetical protein